MKKTQSCLLLKIFWKTTNHQPPPHAEGHDLGTKADSFFPLAAALVRDATTRFFNRPGFKTLREVDRKTPGTLKRIYFCTWVLSFTFLSNLFWERLSQITVWKFVVSALDNHQPALFLGSFEKKHPKGTQKFSRFV